MNCQFIAKILFLPIDYAVGILCVLVSICKELIDAIIVRIYPEANPPSPKELIDFASTAISMRLEKEGFRRLSDSRTMIRQICTTECRVTINANRKYNRVGRYAQFGITLEVTMPKLPPQMAQQWHTLIHQNPESKNWNVIVDLGNLRFFSRIFSCNLAPRIGRQARIKRTVCLLERHALPWFAMTETASQYDALTRIDKAK